MISDIDKNQVLGNMLDLVRASGAQLNRNAVFHGPEAHDWYLISILNAGHVVELAIKAVIARVHPLLLFKDLPKPSSDQAPLSLEQLISAARSHDLVKLPQILWAVAGETLADRELFKRGVRERNAVQHFLGATSDPSELALRFAYGIADPLLAKHFGIFLVDMQSSYDDQGYCVEQLFRHEIPFSVPSALDLSSLEGSPEEALSKTSHKYQKLMLDRFGIEAPTL